MPLHDWSRLDAGAYHGFHGRWIAALTDVLNNGLLPPAFFADGEQIVLDEEQRRQPDVITLRDQLIDFDPPEGGGTATAVATENFVETQVSLAEDLPQPRHLVVRRSQDFEVVALLEIISLANRDRPKSVEQFVDKVQEALEAGVHVVTLDLLAHGRHDPHGLHGAVLDRIAPGEPYAFPGGTARTIASYASDRLDARILVAHPKIGGALPDTPLFLTPKYAVAVPLEQTYLQAWRGTPFPYRNSLETPTPPND